MIKLLGVAAVLLSLSPAFAAPTAPPRGLPPHGAPEFPQSAYAACAGKSSGDTVVEGDVTGTCQKTVDGRVALRPKGPPPKGAPPPRAESPAK